MTTTMTHPEVFDEERRRKAKKATAVGAFGTFIEYYDFSVYGYVAATLAVVFFPSEDPVIGLLNNLPGVRAGVPGPPAGGGVLRPAR